VRNVKAAIVDYGVDVREVYPSEDVPPLVVDGEQSEEVNGYAHVWLTGSSVAHIDLFGEKLRERVFPDEIHDWGLCQPPGASPDKRIRIIVSSGALVDRISREEARSGAMAAAAIAEAAPGRRCRRFCYASLLCFGSWSLTVAVGVACASAVAAISLPAEDTAVMVSAVKEFAADAIKRIV
jgi:hypothetical protein